MSLNFRSKFGRWFDDNYGSGFSLVVFVLVLSFSTNTFAQPQAEQETDQSQLEASQESSQDIPEDQDEAQQEVPQESASSNPENSELSLGENGSLPTTENTPTDEQVDNSEFQRVVVAESFVNLMSGPGRGFPVFYVAEQKESVWILQRRNNWFKVRIAKSKEGWVYISDMQKMFNPDGSSVSFKELTESDFGKRSWELGFRAGDFEGAKVLAVSGAWQATPNLAAEMVLGQGLGDFSETRQATFSVVNSPFPDWRVSPYLGIGIGIIKTLPSASLVQETDRQDEVLFSTAGAKTYITDRFMFRVEYRNYVVLTTQETNEEVEEWTVGFSVFF